MTHLAACLLIISIRFLCVLFSKRTPNGLRILHLWLHASYFTDSYLVFTFLIINPRVLFALPVRQFGSLKILALDLILVSWNMLNVDFRVKQLRLSHVHKIFNGTGPSYLSEQFIKVSDVHHHFTRGSTENFIVPSVNGVAAKTFYYSGIKDWNSLPSDAKQKCIFKSAARQYLRSQLQLMESDTYVYY